VSLSPNSSHTRWSPTEMPHERSRDLPRPARRRTWHPGPEHPV